MKNKDYLKSVLDKWSIKPIKKENRHLNITVQTVTAKSIQKLINDVATLQDESIDVYNSIAKKTKDLDVLIKTIKTFRDDFFKLPQKGVDYFTDEEIEAIKKDVTPIKGKDYFTDEDINLVKQDILTSIDRELSKIKPTTKVIHKTIVKALQIDAKDIVKKLESLKDEDRLSFKAIKGWENVITDLVVDLIYQYRRGGGGGTGGIEDVTDTNTYLRTQGSWVQSDVFTNDDYYIKTEVNDLLADKVNQSDFDNHINNSNIHFDDVIDNATYLRSQGAWIACDVFDADSYYTKTETNALLSTKADQSDLDAHVNDTSIHFADVTDDNTYLRTQGGWTASDVFTSTNYYTKTETNTLLDDKVNVTDFNNHVNNSGIHFTMLDEDDFASNSDTQAATQQSIKAYVDNSISALDIRTDHNTLDNLQGGTTNEYYHLTSVEHTAILDLINNPIDADKVDGYDVVGLDLNEVAYYDGVNITGSANLTFDGTTFSAYELFIGSGGIFSNSNHRGINKVVSLQKDSSTLAVLTFEDGILVSYSERSL